MVEVNIIIGIFFFFSLVANVALFKAARELDDDNETLKSKVKRMENEIDYLRKQKDVWYEKYLTARFHNYKKHNDDLFD